MKFGQLIKALGANAESNSLVLTRSLNPRAIDLEITGLAAIDRASSGNLSWIEGDLPVGESCTQIQQTIASALILPLDATLQAQASQRRIAWIASPVPHYVLAKAIALLYQPFSPSVNIDPTAKIHPSAQIGAGASIEAHVVIYPNVTIGSAVTIYPNVVIYPNAVIGDRTILHANCVIHERSQIGADCMIHSGAAIGAEGFGFVPESSGWLKVPQAGCTVLEDGVEVGCNTTIDRPELGETRVGAGTKIDNLVQIGHGCQVGRNCYISAQVGLARRVQVGDNVRLLGQVGIANWVRIGDRARVMARSGVIGDVAPEAEVAGCPAMPSQLWRKTEVLKKRLPDFYKLLKATSRSLTQ
jgi:UDP-3-O-[3-hydroxymyristoyl] glucosamine N-acyltransferase